MGKQLLWCTQSEVQQLKQSNTTLSQRLALHEVEGPRSPHPRPPLKQLPVASQTASLPEDSHPAGVKQQEQADKLQLDGNEASQGRLHTQLPKARHRRLIAFDIQINCNRVLCCCMIYKTCTYNATIYIIMSVYGIPEAAPPPDAAGILLGSCSFGGMAVGTAGKMKTSHLLCL